MNKKNDNNENSNNDEQQIIANHILHELIKKKIMTAKELVFRIVTVDGMSSVQLLSENTITDVSRKSKPPITVEKAKYMRKRKEKVFARFIQ